MDTMNELPIHIRDIEFKPYHFYYNKKAKKGENPLLLQDNFIDDIMREKKYYSNQK